MDKVQIALYSGTVTVGENAHVGTLEAKMTSSSGQILDTNFVMNGQVDNLILSQCSSKSTATLNGIIGSLTLNLGTEIYGTRTFPTTIAGEKFSVNNLSIAPSLSSATSFNETTGRTADGMVSIAALKDPAQPVEDLVLIQGGGDKVANGTWTTSYSFEHTDGKDYKFLTTVDSVDGNIVLHKTVVNGNYVFLDGVNGQETNDGITLNTPVKTFETAKKIAQDKGQNTINVLGTVTISESETWEGNIIVESFPTFNGTLVKIPNGASLTLTNVTLDGQGITRDVPLVENRGNLTIADGAELTGGVNKVIYSPNNGQGLDGGAIYNSGTLTMTGGKIFDNSARTGGGVFSKGTFELSGGEITNNYGYGGRFSYSYGGSSKVNSAPAGGGVFLANGVMTMTGGKITANSSSVGGGIALGNETNAYTSYGGPKLTMAGGTIDGNTAGQGGGIFIQKQCEAIISGGFITNNTATGDFSVATGGQFLYGGGGIYVNGNMDGKTPDGKLTMQSPVITNNTASRTGGGIAGCPSANVDLKVDDSGIIAGNTVNGKPYDVYVELGIVIQPGGGQHKGGRFYLSKYMAGGVLYNWTYQSTGERVPMQDVYNFDVKSDRYPDRNGGFYADVDSKVVQAVAAKCKGVVISGNHSASSGGGIGTNGEVNIGKNPELNDFFDVTVTKQWQNEDGTEMTPEQKAELKENIKSITVQLYRRAVNNNQGPNDNWELVDSRLILPNGEGFWEMERAFKNLLKYQLDENGNKIDLEYQVREVASVTGAWGEINGGSISVVTPAIGNTGDTQIEVVGLVNQLTPSSLKLVKKVGDESLKGQTFHFTITFKDKVTDEIIKTIDNSVTVPKDAEGSEAVEVLTADDLKGIPAGTKFTVEEKTGDWSTSWIFSNENTNKSSYGNVAEGVLYYGVNEVTFTNYAPHEVPIRVTKKVTGDTPDSIPGFTFTLDVHDETKNNDATKDGYILPNDKEITISNEDFVNGNLEKSFDSIKFTKNGTYKFTVHESSGNATGWTYDTAVYTVIISVTNAEDGKLEAEITSIFTVDKDGSKVEIGPKNPIPFSNSFEEWRGNLTIKKAVEGIDQDTVDNTFTFEVTGPANYKKTVTISKANGWQNTLYNLNPGEYTVTELENGTAIANYTWSVTGNGTTASVVAKGTVEVTITNTYTPPYTPNPTPHYYYQLITYYITHLADGTIRYDGVNVQQVEVTEGKHNEVYTANEGDAGRYFFSAGDYTEYKDNSYSFIPGYTPEDSKYRDSVHEIKLTEPNTRRNPYTLVMWYERMEIEEEPTPLSTTLTVEKVWEGDGDVQRPANVTVQLMKDGAAEGAPIVLSEANEWSYTWIALDAQSTWTVAEVDVPEGYTSSSSTNEDGTIVTITNTYTPTDVPDEEPPKTDTPDEPVDVPDEQPPLTDLPDEQPPLAEIPVEWPPLAEIPVEQPPLVEVPEDIPLIPAEPEVTVPEEPVPMVGIPQTGDFSMAWYAVAILSALGLAVLTLKKREDEEG